MEPKGKGCYENDEDDHKLDEGVDDVIEDDDVLAEDGHLPHVDQEVDPSHGDGHCTSSPHPAGLEVGLQFESIIQCRVVEARVSNNH